MRSISLSSALNAPSVGVLVGPVSENGVGVAVNVVMTPESGFAVISAGGMVFVGVTSCADFGVGVLVGGAVSEPLVGVSVGRVELTGRVGVAVLVAVRVGVGVFVARCGFVGVGVGVNVRVGGGVFVGIRLVGVFVGTAWNPPFVFVGVGTDCAPACSPAERATPIAAMQIPRAAAPKRRRNMGSANPVPVLAHSP